MKVYIVIGNESSDIYKVCATKEKAEKAAKYAEWCAEMGGSHAMYWVEEHTVEEE